MTATLDRPGTSVRPRALWQHAWFRWPAYMFLGMAVLQITEWVSDPQTDELISGAQASAMLRWAVPLLLAGLGGLFSERAGVVNIGLEGMMVLGTWFGAWGSVQYGPVWGTVVGIVGGALGGLLHAVATISFGVNHIISAVAINLMAPGIARYLSDELFTDMSGGSITQSPRVPSAGSIDLPVLDRVSWLTIIAFALVPISWFLLWRTRFGLRLRSCGEHPVAADSLGVNVYRYKYYGVVISGGLAGMAGSFIVTELTGIYREGQVNGRGFIGLATMIFGNWRPGGTALGALLFGYADGLQLRDRNGIHALLLVGAVAMLLLAVRALLRKEKVPVRTIGIEPRADVPGGWRWTVRRKAVSVALPGLIGVGLLVWYLTTDTVPRQLPQVTPHILTLVVLVFSGSRLRMPAADGVEYRKGDH
jgi:general nucleoside transport system permease protein